MEPAQQIAAYKNVNVKDYVHSLYQAKYLTNLSNVIMSGASYKQEFNSIPKAVIKSLNDEYNVESPYFNLVKGNDKYKVKKGKPKTSTKKEVKGKKIRAGEISEQSSANTFLATGRVN